MCCSWYGIQRRSSLLSSVSGRRRPRCRNLRTRGAAGTARSTSDRPSRFLRKVQPGTPTATHSVGVVKNRTNSDWRFLPKCKNDDLPELASLPRCCRRFSLQRTRTRDNEPLRRHVRTRFRYQQRSNTVLYKTTVKHDAKLCKLDWECLDRCAKLVPVRYAQSTF